MDLRWTGDGPGINSRWIGDGLAMDWRWIGDEEPWDFFLKLSGLGKVVYIRILHRFLSSLWFLPDGAGEGEDVEDEGHGRAEMAFGALSDELDSGGGGIGVAASVQRDSATKKYNECISRGCTGTEAYPVWFSVLTIISRRMVKRVSGLLD